MADPEQIVSAEPGNGRCTGHFYLQSLRTGLYLREKGLNIGAPAVQGRKDDEQIWLLYPADGPNQTGHWFIRSAYSGLSLDVLQGTGQNGAPVGVAIPIIEQVWDIHEAPENQYYYITTNIKADDNQPRNLDVLQGGGGPAHPIDQSPVGVAHPTSHQAWKLIKTDPPSHSHVRLYQSRCHVRAESQNTVSGSTSIEVDRGFLVERAWYEWEHKPADDKASFHVDFSGKRRTVTMNVSMRNNTPQIPLVAQPIESDLMLCVIASDLSSIKHAPQNIKAESDVSRSAHPIYPYRIMDGTVYTAGSFTIKNLETNTTKSIHLEQGMNAVAIAIEMSRACDLAGIRTTVDKGACLAACRLRV
jgi:hypothetical protein